MNLTIRIGLLVTVGGIDVVGRGLVLVSELGVVLGQGDEGVTRLRPLLGHLEQVGGPLVALQGLILLVLPPVISEIIALANKMENRLIWVVVI